MIPAPDRAPASSPTPPLARSLMSLLAFTAIAHLGYQLRLGLDAADVGPFETVLARAVAGHFDPEVGPGGFYGPFSGENPSVLMHAPLYYRLTALAAWPAVRLGADPLAAVLYAGRLLSMVGSLGAFAAVAGLAGLDRHGHRAGLLAAALLAASPILGNLVAMLRPDAMGVGLQTLGALLVLRTLRGEGGAGRLILAYVLFAMAALIKQQNVTVAAVCSMLLVAGWLKDRRIGIGPIVAAHAAAVAVAAADLLLEDALTGGRMFRTVVVYPGGPFREINYAGWAHVLSIMDITARRCIGLAALALACGWGLRRQILGNRLDAVLLLFLAVELAALVPLCLYNAGAAYNYALQAVVFGCAFVGRSLDRLLERAAMRREPIGRLLTPAALALVVLLMADMHWVSQNARARASERADLAALMADERVARQPAEARYFVERQGLNRLFGRADLIHDDWLYGAFERIAAAEPRDGWLRETIVRGPIRQVVAPEDRSTVPGVADPLPALGYRQVARGGGLVVWERR